MCSPVPIRLPVIDFSKQNLKAGTPERDCVKIQVREALEEYGCFEALLDKVMELRKGIFGAVEALFDLPLETKELCVSDKLFRGYCGTSSTTPLLESMSIDESNSAESIEQRLTNILWPQGNTCFSKTLLSFTELASGLEKTIRGLVLESFGLEKYRDEHMDLTNYLLRVMKYEGTQTSEPVLGARAHYDQSMVTVLYQNEVNGLQIQTKDGEWISVQPSPASFIVMIGESLNVWLNGRLPCPYHRVIMSGNKARYSVGLFATPRGGHKVMVPHELVDEENPMLFKPFDFEEFLEFYFMEIDRGADLTGLRGYCSV